MKYKRGVANLLQRSFEKPDFGGLSGHTSLPLQLNLPRLLTVHSIFDEWSICQRFLSPKITVFFKNTVAELHDKTQSVLKRVDDEDVDLF